MVIKRPPMGWNSWNTFGSNINEDLIKETADAMVSSGLKDAGYEYVVIDDCWAKRERNEKGMMEADPEKFPSGMKALADYIHSKGLKFGMYSCDGVMTCAGYPGSCNYEFIDAQMFADFEIDYLKYDNCYRPNNMPGRILYNKMAMALKATGRDIVFSACNWGVDNVHEWIRSTGAHLYRSTGDINDSFASFRDIGLSQANMLGYSAPGCYNDIDMLICGMYGKGNVAVSGCSDLEYNTHFAMWSLFSSPLMIGCDIRNMNEATKKILTNKELIAINQDEDTRPPFEITRHGNRVSYLRHMADGNYIIALFNLDDSNAIVPAYFQDIGIEPGCGFAFDLVDIFTGEEKKGVYDGLCMTIPAHDCKIYRAKLVPHSFK